MAKGKEKWLPPSVRSFRKCLREALDSRDSEGRIIGNAKYGVYTFYDFDGEPIYVGCTAESIRTRVRRHLTNQRTDAVAMNVLDPFEVTEIELWPLWELEGLNEAEVKSRLNMAEFTVFQLVLEKSIFHAVLNEKEIVSTERIALPKSHRFQILPTEEVERLRHADLRIARRANTIAKLAQIISERDVSTGLRKTLLTQARRLENLARRRLDELGIDYDQ